MLLVARVRRCTLTRSCDAVLHGVDAASYDKLLPAAYQLASKAKSEAMAAEAQSVIDRMKERDQRRIDKTGGRLVLGCHSALTRDRSGGGAQRQNVLGKRQIDGTARAPAFARHV